MNRPKANCNESVSCAQRLLPFKTEDAVGAVMTTDTIDLNHE